jgi:hypothetical protein
MSHPFLEEWAAWEPQSPPYVFPGDALLSSSADSARAFFTSPEAYIDSPQFLDPKDATLHLGLHPIPMLGDLGRAKVIFLLLNPGLKPGDYFAEQDPAYRDGLRRSTQQKFTGVEYPFLFLDPAFSWHSGFLWWTRKLRVLIQRAQSQKGGGVKGALCCLAKSVANIELYPYHSLKFKLSKKVCSKLPSAKLAKSYVHKVLLPKARSGEIALVVLRRAKEWEVPSGRGVYTFGSGEARGAHLSERTKIGQAVLAHLGLDKRCSQTPG